MTRSGTFAPGTEAVLEKLPEMEGSKNEADNLQLEVGGGRAEVQSPHLAERRRTRPEHNSMMHERVATRSLLLSLAASLEVVRCAKCQM